MAAARQMVGQIGSQLFTTFTLFDRAIANPDNANLMEYERMVDTDETVAAGIEFMILSTLLKLDRYTHDSPKIQDFVNEALEDMAGSLVEACTDILSGIWAGYSGTEIVWKPSGSRITIDYLATYHPRTVFFNVDQQTGRLDRDCPIKQYRWFSGSPVDIPKNKAIIYTHNVRFGNPYGVSQLRRIRKNWLLKDPVLKMWVNAVDKFGAPTVAAMVPDGELEDPQNPGHMISNIEYMARVLSNLQNGTGIAMASGTKEENTDIKFHSPGAGMGDAFHMIITYLNKMIFRGMLVPSLVFDEGQQSGSYALGKSHFGMYQLILDRIFKNLAEILLEQLVRPLVEMNFGPQKKLGEFPEREMNDEDIQILSSVFLQMTNGGYLDPTVEDDYKHVRSKLGFPERKLDAEAQREKVRNEYAKYLKEDDDQQEKTDE
ncbi:Protein of unknown function [Paenibacillus tianmuensis]|uniref:Portal protein n=1 Tax=Paenibacillus tianmuensis TaxID=624147 RepID=A0A1G4TXZ3_9BACL|nr:DUF935 family protein [Paenibacillus tianmuensis]SCW86234.1 Protein of unknown function [Paenibacillus tianmuensis]